MKILIVICCFASFAALAQNGAAVGTSGSVQLGSPGVGTTSINEDTMIKGETPHHNVDTIVPADSGSIRGTGETKMRSRTRRSTESYKGFRERGYQGADGQIHYNPQIDPNRFEEINDR